ncbi:hypothetical protein [Microvirga sp. M2]|uniref:hypothetical protein n=1 Tax=Microvirga sp. M2 TaxID=3073270 RepID=UPI0039C12D27
MGDQTEMVHSFAEYWSIVAGCVVVLTYAKRRFNEPSGTNSKALPQAVEPLRYLYLKSQYKTARAVYVLASVVLYLLLLLPGPLIMSVSNIDPKIFPPQAWALLVALVLVGFVPNTANFRWVLTIEEELRRFVHERYFVPRRVEETISLLQDVSYDPPSAQTEMLPAPLRAAIFDGLKAPTNSLAYRWARTRMLMASLSQIGTGTSSLLTRADFEPFEKDFEYIQEKYDELSGKIERVIDSDLEVETERKLKAAVDALLDKIYAYITWGVRQRASTEGEINETLLTLGFDIPPENDISLFNVVFPAVLSVGGVAFVFSCLIDVLQAAFGNFEGKIATTVVAAFASAMAASVMYWAAVHLALSGRKDQIRRKVWHERSPICLVPIGIKAGLVTWAVIVVSTIVWHPILTWDSMYSSWRALKLSVVGSGGLPFSEWNYVFLKAASALPWLFAGLMVSSVIAWRLGGDVRKSDRSSQLRDALWLGCWLGVTASLASLLQTSEVEYLRSVGVTTATDSNAIPLTPSEIVWLTFSSGLAGFVCGTILGLKVPATYKMELQRPTGKVGSKALRDLLTLAERTTGTRAAAEEWVFSPNEELNGLTPAEGVRYRELTTGVRRLIQTAYRPVRSMPSVIEGGLAS